MATLQTMYSGMVNSPTTELSAAIDAAQTSISVLNGAALPAAPNLATIGNGETAETIRYTGKSGNTLTGVTRGFQGSARSWSVGQPVARQYTAYDHDTARVNVESLASEVVGHTAQLAETEQQLLDVPLLSLNEIRNHNTTIGKSDITVFRKSLITKSSKVVFWGDSITEHSNAIDASSKYSSVYEQKLRESFKDVSFTFYNRGIGGTNLSNAVNPNYIPIVSTSRPWTENNTKSWREVIKDLEPDLLFVAFGMNAESGMDADYNSLFTYLNTFAKVPTVVLVSNPLPASEYTEGITQWGNMRTTREKARQYDCFCIDAGRNSVLVTKGIDEYNFFGERIDGFDNFISLDDSITKTNSQTIFNINNRYIRSDKKYYNFKINLNCDFSNSGAFWVEFRNSKNVILFEGQRNRVEFYPVVGQLQASYNKTLSGTMNISVEVIGADINIYFDGVREYTFKNCYSDMIEKEIFLCANGSNLPLVISNVTVIGYMPEQVSPISNDTEIFGEYVAGDSSTKMPYGGNGWNHPSSIGVKLLYSNGVVDLINRVASDLGVFVPGDKMMGNLDFADGRGLRVLNGNALSFLHLADFPEVSSELAEVRLFRNTNTTGVKRFYLFKGDGSAASSFGIINGEIVSLNGNNYGITSHTASPEGAISKPVGHICITPVGLFYKATGSGNTGWKAVQTV